jgi:tRNA-dihydrouridine synthase B
MIGRGAYGRPWIAASIDRALSTGEDIVEPDLTARLDIALDHFHDSLGFYGDLHGVRIFRKHLGWYLENAPWPVDADARRAGKSKACRLTEPKDVETFLIDFWNRNSQATYH